MLLVFLFPNRNAKVQPSEIPDFYRQANYAVISPLNKIVRTIIQTIRRQYPENKTPLRRNTTKKTNIDTSFYYKPS